MSKIKPIGNRVLAKPITREAKTKGGIILDDREAEKESLAEIIEIGTGEKVSMFNVGDRVIYPKYQGTKIVLETENYIILRDDECLAIVE